MKSSRFLFVFMFLFVFAAESREIDTCETALRANKSEESLLKERFGTSKSSWDALAGLSPVVQSTEVNFHTSRSPIRASDDFPRKVYFDDSDPTKHFVYAFSMRPESGPVLEIQSFDRETKTTAFYVTEWSGQKGFNLQKDPPRCYACHSAGRPIFSGMISTDHWPFTYKEDTENARWMEKKLSALNIEMQMKDLKQKEFDSKWIELMNSALYDTVDVFERKFAKSKTQYKNHEIEDYYYSQREIFLQMMGAQPKQLGPFLTENDYRQMRILKVLELKKMDRLLDQLSLQIRPANYELGTDAQEAIESWVKNLKIQIPEKPKSWRQL